MSYHNSSTPSSSSPKRQGTSYSTNKSAPAGYHYMPDGSLMLNSQMRTSSPVYSNTRIKDKVYSSKVDLKGLSDKLTFIFYATRNIKGLEPLNKKFWCELTYDVP